MGIKLIKNTLFIVAILLLTAFVLRFYAATSVPLISVENQKLSFARTISFNLEKLNLPVGDKVADCPPFVFYLIKLGITLFGDSMLGGRFLFILFGVFSLYFFYKLVEENLGVSQGLLVLFILVFSQFHIGISRLMIGESPLCFFTALALYFFFKALRTKEKRWVYLTGIAVGIGYLCREFILLLLPVFLIFLISEKKYRFWFKRKDLYLSCLASLVIMSPFILWTLKDNFAIYTTTDDQLSKIGFSYRAFYLYFGEIFAWLSEKTSSIALADPSYFGTEGCFAFLNGRLRLVVDGSNEFPFVHWVEGVLIFCAVFYYALRYSKMNDLLKLSLLIFTLIFLIVSFMGFCPNYRFDKHLWASITFYPGVILCASMLVDLLRRHKFMKAIVLVLLAHLVYRSFCFVALPENLFAVPRSNLCKYYLQRADYYAKNNEIEKARDRYQWVADRCDKERI